MARRRMDENVEDDGTRQEQGLGGDNTYDPQNPFGNGRDRPDAFFDLSPEEQQSIIGIQDDAIAGNTDSARSLGPSMPNTIGQGPQSAPQPFALPRGVSANEGVEMGWGGDYSQDAPAMPMEPSPTAAQRPNPQPAFRGTPQASQTARRVSAAPSALFGQEGSSSMFGRAGGLLGGGQGVLGAGDDGEIEPTEMFKKLLQMYGQQ